MWQKTKFEGVDVFEKIGADGTSLLRVQVESEAGQEIASANDFTLSVPKKVSMRQARLALLQANLLDQVDAAIAASSQEIKIAWEFSSEVERKNPIIESISTTLGLSNEQIDNLFILASTL